MEFEPTDGPAHPGLTIESKTIMATKNLARTVIEGGRTGYSKYHRHNSNRGQRRRERAFIYATQVDPDFPERQLMPVRMKAFKDHADRLSAAESWLASHVGKRWDFVRAEIARRFDTRTIAGLHIVFDHLLPSVRGSGSTKFGRKDFAIDDHGVLVRVPARCGWMDKNI